MWVELVRAVVLFAENNLDVSRLFPMKVVPGCVVLGRFDGRFDDRDTKSDP